MADCRELEQQLTVFYLASYHPKPYPIPCGSALGMCLPNPKYHVLKKEPKGDCWHCFGLYGTTMDVQWGECSWEYLMELCNEHKTREKARMAAQQIVIEMRKQYNLYCGHYAASTYAMPFSKWVQSFPK